MKIDEIGIRQEDEFILYCIGLNKIAIEKGSNIKIPDQKILYDFSNVTDSVFAIFK